AGRPHDPPVVGRPPGQQRHDKRTRSSAPGHGRSLCQAAACPRPASGDAQPVLSRSSTSTAERPSPSATVPDGVDTVLPGWSSLWVATWLESSTGPPWRTAIALPNGSWKPRGRNPSLQYTFSLACPK